MTWGGWIEDDLDSDSVLVCVPGNPGITDFYFYFLENLHSLIGIPIWVINHAGTEPAPPNFSQPSLDEHPELFNLAGQVKHFKAFINKYVPENKKLFLIGHSVGGKICVELMKNDDIASRASQIHLVFPTLLHINQSPNGKLFTSYIQYLIPVIIFLAWLIGIVPQFVQLNMVSVYFWARGAWKNCHMESCVRGTLKLFRWGAAKSSLSLAKDEMYKINDLDNEIYENYYDRIFCYFAQNDRWAPLFQYHQIMEKHPKIQGVILDSKFTHSFVLTTPVDMAQVLAKNIETKLKN